MIKKLLAFIGSHPLLAVAAALAAIGLTYPENGGLGLVFLAAPVATISLF